MRVVITEKMRKEAEKGNSILKVSRTRAGGAKGAVGAGIVFLVFALFSGLLLWFLAMAFVGVFMFLLLGIPGLIFVGIGAVLQRKKAKNYLEFYKKESGYDESELRQAERELLMPQTVAIGSSADTGRRKQPVHCYITENFLVSLTLDACYVRKLSDMRAAFYSQEIPGGDSLIRGLVLISRQDIAREPRTNPFTYRQCGGYTDALLEKEDCAEVAAEITKRNPSVITSQRFSDGKKEHNLLSMDCWEEDWEAILRVL